MPPISIWFGTRSSTFRSSNWATGCSQPVWFPIHPAFRGSCPARQPGPIMVHIWATCGRWQSGTRGSPGLVMTLTASSIGTACTTCNVSRRERRNPPLTEAPVKSAAIICLVVFGWMITCGAKAWAQGVETSDPTAAPPVTEPIEETARGGAGVTALVAPLPFRNSQLGWGAALMVGLIHRFDADTSIKPSTGAVVGLASENGSWGVMATEMARLARDTWRARGAVGYMDLKYDFYGVGVDAGEAGVSVPLNQTVFLASGALLRHVVSGLYVGGQILWLMTTVSLQDSVGPIQPEVPNQAQTELFAGGLEVRSAP